eukprot:CAMPEP_0113283758 /NCGR_PEP_ID=MMETSP0008_2-20120614/29630_1 /TAXON_ID=97485 /ORGANISM="Prymnesium parvum" /LENGTH=466 /DNA_ID=CAMNT_0000134513 /DNA_START=91 /DNA_END=1491 /DNA_ORIENTATION=- /assembly_acc=CAM_ASM_000153
MRASTLLNACGFDVSRAQFPLARRVCTAATSMFLLHGTYLVLSCTHLSGMFPLSKNKRDALGVGHQEARMALACASISGSQTRVAGSLNPTSNTSQDSSEFVVARLAPHCSMWCTLNEPVGFAVCGWLAGVHPPGKSGQLMMVIKVVHNLMRGHFAAAAAINAASAVQPQPPSILIANNVICFEALNKWNPFTRFLAVFLNLVYDFLIHDVLIYGRLPWWPLPFQLIAWVLDPLFGARATIRAYKGTVNMIGLNHYFREYCAFGYSRQVEVYKGGDATTGTGDMIWYLPFGCTFRAGFDPRFEKSDMGWDMTPSSMLWILTAFSDRYPGVPIYITESGLADSSQPDKKRVRYISGVLRAIRKALDAGIDVRGYTIWSLIDNFEWAEGFRPRFGLAHVDYSTQVRTPRSSCNVLRRIISNQRKQLASIRALPPRTTPDFRDKVKTYLLDAMPFELGMSTLTRTHHFT